MCGREVTFFGFVFILTGVDTLSRETIQGTVARTGPMTTMIRYRSRVAYDGRSFSGFQLQRHRKGKICTRTVQGALEEVLNRRLLLRGDIGCDVHCDEKARVIKVVAASRTDAGVHARGQAIHFDVPFGSALDKINNNHNTDNLARLCDSLNRMLPPDVRLWKLQRVPGTGTVTKPVASAQFTSVDVHDDGGNFVNDALACDVDTLYATYSWNVLFDSTQKLYSYRLSLEAVMDPMERFMRWHPTQSTEINVDTLRRILSLYVGTHDFRAFAGAVERTEKSTGITQNTIRTVYAVDLVKEDKDGYFRIDFVLKGALYKQVRNMVGTALDVCRGKVSEEQLMKLLRQDTPLSRIDNRSKPAPPEGLTLEHVYFDDPDF